MGLGEEEGNGDVQCIDLILQIRDSRKGSIQLVECILKVGWKCDILQGIQAGDAELGHADVPERIDLVDSRNSARDGRVGRADITLDRCPYSTERG